MTRKLLMPLISAPNICDLIASATERRADEAERDTDKLKMVQYMSAHIGEYFDGVNPKCSNNVAAGPA